MNIFILPAFASFANLQCVNAFAYCTNEQHVNSKHVVVLSYQVMKIGVYFLKQASSHVIVLPLSLVVSALCLLYILAS
jgi:hypothetical protein